MKTKKPFGRRQAKKKKKEAANALKMYERAVLHAVNQGLIQALALGNGLDDGLLRGYKADGPLPEPSAAQAEHIAVSAQRESIRHQSQSRLNQGMKDAGAWNKGRGKRHTSIVHLFIDKKGNGCKPSRLVDKSLKDGLNLIIGHVSASRRTTRHIRWTWAVGAAHEMDTYAW